MWFDGLREKKMLQGCGKVCNNFGEQHLGTLHHGSWSVIADKRKSTALFLLSLFISLIACTCSWKCAFLGWSISFFCQVVFLFSPWSRTFAGDRKFHGSETKTRKRNDQTVPMKFACMGKSLCCCGETAFLSSKKSHHDTFTEYFPTFLFAGRLRKKSHLKRYLGGSCRFMRNYVRCFQMTYFKVTNCFSERSHVDHITNRE